MVSFLVAAAKIDRDLVDAVGMEDDEVFVARVKAYTRFSGWMAELHPQTQQCETNPVEEPAGPFLRKNKNKRTGLDGE